MEKVQNVEDAIAILKTILTMLDTGKEYSFVNDDPLDVPERCDWIKEKLNKVKELVQNI
jgi:hypothetical protein